MPDGSPPESPDPTAPERKEWMGVLAKAPAEQLAAAVDDLGNLPAFDWLRAPEFGSVMVRGRAGGTGAPFNLGEMTVTRCALQLDGGEVGHAYIAGRDRTKAEQAALCDALLQGPRADEVQARVIEPLAADLARVRGERAGKAAGTKVDFFTLVRGED
ncbi:MAG: phosphonate C-P lyase system protein PhnG [Pseudomonadota bacterium]